MTPRAIPPHKKLVPETLRSYIERSLQIKKHLVYLHNVILFDKILMHNIKCVVGKSQYYLHLPVYPSALPPVGSVFSRGSSVVAQPVVRVNVYARE